MENSQVHIKQRGLMLFSNDLRLHDNPALARAAEMCESLACVYIVNPRWFETDRFGCRHIGEHRWRFLLESLADLQASLMALGQRLLVLQAEPRETIAALLDANRIDALFVSDHALDDCDQAAVYYSNSLLCALEEVFPRLHIIRKQASTLFSQDNPALDLGDLPGSFTPFRTRVENLPTVKPIRAPITLPAILVLEQEAFAAGNREIDSYMRMERALDGRSSTHHGGENAALEQLQQYFSPRNVDSGHSDASQLPPVQYKDTRNALAGWLNSTKFSAWLANGSLSVRTLKQALELFERNISASESTYWIYFELLWREFFYWHTKRHSDRIFALEGVRSKKPLASFYPSRFKQWCEGTTIWPLVNAGMRELNATGYISNRMRQIVASCLVNELQLDWRAGARYFEQQLIDYDTSANWGNWQYIAGVGADPRGGRHFNLKKQAQIYDPDGSYAARWCKASENRTPAMGIGDTVDAADWPIA
ncbi:MAG: DASH family cryptochrome [Pseudomonadales bacterium]